VDAVSSRWRFLEASGLQTVAEDVEIADGLRIHYEQAGHGKIPIVFIPGWAMSGAIFEHQLAYFADWTSHRAMAFDPRGQGLSAQTEGGHHYEQRGRDLNAFLDKLNLRDVILAGWSNGVLDALAYINQFGSRNLKALIMIDGTPKSSGDDNRKEWIWFTRDDADRSREGYTLGSLRDRRSTNRALAEWLLEQPTPERVAWLIEMAKQTSDTIAAVTNEAGAYMDFSADLEALDGRIPLLYAVRDEWKQVASDWCRQRTPSAEFVAFGKHLNFWERSTQFNEVLSAFLRRSI
jgi:non-heme chloroperoxidase